MPRRRDGLRKPPPAWRCFAALNLDCTGDGVHDTAEFSENTVARSVCDMPAMHLDRGVQDFASVDSQTRERTHLVGAHQPAVSRHVGRKNSREVPFNSRLFHGELHEPEEKTLSISACPDQGVRGGL